MPITKLLRTFIYGSLIGHMLFFSVNTVNGIVRSHDGCIFTFLKKMSNCFPKKLIHFTVSLVV